MLHNHHPRSLCGPYWFCKTTWTPNFVNRAHAYKVLYCFFQVALLLHGITMMTS